MDFAVLKDAASFAAALIAIGAAVYAWITAKSKTNSESIGNLAKSVSDLTRRVDHVEDEVGHLPDRDSVHKMELSISEIRGEIGKMTASFEAVERTAHRIENYLLNGKTT